MIFEILDFTVKSKFFVRFWAKILRMSKKSCTFALQNAKELGKWILDVTKYIATVGIIAPFLAKSDQWYWFLILICIDALLVVLGLYLSKENINSKKGRK